MLLVGAFEPLPVKVGRDEIPVDEVVEDRLQEAWTLVAIIDVISMLPHIEGQQRDEAVDRGRVGVVQ